MVQTFRVLNNILVCRLQGIIHFLQSGFLLLKVGSALIKIVYFLSYGLGFITQSFKHLDGRLAIHREDYFGL